ncbi:MAG TPA: SGNH/GDSL hydrolase family protein [Clostridia bacterium]|nr:SGNH/GDSL hydrolase family protein [Clostridia bacterium]
MKRLVMMAVLLYSVAGFAQNARTSPAKETDAGTKQYVDLEASADGKDITPNSVTAKSVKANSVASLVVEGASNAAGYGLADADKWDVKAGALSNLVGRGPRYNVATSGHTIGNIVADYASQVYPLRPAVTGNTPTYLVVIVGHNDITVGGTSAAMFASLKAYWLQAKADGFTVIAATISRSPRITGQKDIERIGYNALIRSSNDYEYLLDLDSLLPDNLDMSFFQADGVHYGAGATSRIAQALNAIIGSAGSQASTPNPRSITSRRGRH